MIWKNGRKVSWNVKWYGKYGSEKIWKMQKKIVKRYEKYGRKVNWIVKWYGECGRKVSWKVKYGRKASRIVKRFGKYRRKLWKDMKNMEEK